MLFLPLIVDCSMILSFVIEQYSFALISIAIIHLKLIIMKKIIILLVAAIAINAGENEIKAQPSEKLMINALMTSINIHENDDELSKDDVDAVNSKAIRHFNRVYKRAEKVKWSVLKDGFLARFTTGEIIEKIFYYTNGNFAGTLKGYDAGMLTADVQQIVKQQYPGCKILYINEAEIAGRSTSPTYILQLQDEKDLKVVRICDEETDVLFDSNKQSKYPARF